MEHRAVIMSERVLLQAAFLQGHRIPSNFILEGNVLEKKPKYTSRLSEVWKQ